MCPIALACPRCCLQDAPSASTAAAAPDAGGFPSPQLLDRSTLAAANATPPLTPLPVGATAALPPPAGFGDSSNATLALDAPPILPPADTASANTATPTAAGGPQAPPAPEVDTFPDPPPAASTAPSSSPTLARQQQQSAPAPSTDGAGATCDWRQGHAQCAAGFSCIPGRDGPDAQGRLSPLWRRRAVPLCRLGSFWLAGRGQGDGSDGLPRGEAVGTALGASCWSGRNRRGSPTWRTAHASWKASFPLAHALPVSGHKHHPCPRRRAGSRAHTPHPNPAPPQPRPGPPPLCCSLLRRQPARPGREPHSPRPRRARGVLPADGALPGALACRLRPRIRWAGCAGKWVGAGLAGAALGAAPDIRASEQSRRAWLIG